MDTAISESARILPKSHVCGKHGSLRRDAQMRNTHDDRALEVGQVEQRRVVDLHLFPQIEISGRREFGRIMVVPGHRTQSRQQLVRKPAAEVVRT